MNELLPEKLNLTDAFTHFHDYWRPRVAGEVNDQFVKLAKLKGEFVWHRHEHEDEMFLVLKGELTIRFRSGDVTLTSGEMVIVPRGLEHQPIAAAEAHVLLVEPKSTVNTGNVRDERTVEQLEWIPRE